MDKWAIVPQSHCHLTGRRSWGQFSVELVWSPPGVGFPPPSKKAYRLDLFPHFWVAALVACVSNNQVAHVRIF